MTKRKIFLIVLLIILIISVLHFLQHYGPFAPRFCDQFDSTVSNKYADLIRKLNNYSTCRDPKYNIFDNYIYWKGEIIAATKNDVLVFKGSDTWQDWSYDLMPYKGERLFSNIELIYNDIKDKINEIDSKRSINVITGWSLGAILSCMTGLDFKTDIKSVILFGLPNIFTENFIKQYNAKLGSKTIVYNHILDIFVNAFGYGKNRENIGQTKWVESPLIESHKLLTGGLAHFHMSYLKK